MSEHDPNGQSDADLKPIRRRVFLVDLAAAGAALVGASVLGLFAQSSSAAPRAKGTTTPAPPVENDRIGPPGVPPPPSPAPSARPSAHPSKHPPSKSPTEHDHVPLGGKPVASPSTKGSKSASPRPDEGDNAPKPGKVQVQSPSSPK